jgi:Zn finger protein HypA/HybF involved in hydrogenase expression
MSKHQVGKKPVMVLCKACRRRVRPELLDGSFLCERCRGDAAAMWLEVVGETRRGRRK